MKYIITVIVIVLIVLLIVKSKNSKTDKIETIKYLEFSYTTGYAYNADVSYKITCENNCNIIIKPNGSSEKEAKEYPISNNQINEIISILNNYNVIKWDSFNKSDKNVLDGNSFHFYLKQKDNSSISASGYMKYPQNYHQVKKELEKNFNK